MKRSTILISISYLLFVGLNIGLSIVLIDQIKMNGNHSVSTEQLELSSSDEYPVFDVRSLTDGKYIKTSIQQKFSKAKAVVIDEIHSITASRERNEQVRNYIPLNPVYNFLQ